VIYKKKLMTVYGEDGRVELVPPGRYKGIAPLTIAGQAISGLTAPDLSCGQVIKRAKVLFKRKKRSFVFNNFSPPKA
jgi:hypothetical protein